MSKNEKPEGSDQPAKKPAAKGKRTRKTLVRKTRYLALEPRIVFDGALAADIVDKTTQAAGEAAKSAADSSTAAADRTLPAVDWSQTSVPAAQSADGKSVPAQPGADKAVEERGVVSDASTTGARNEIHTFPSFLRDQRHFFYLRAPESPGIYLGSLDVRPEQ